MTLRKTYLIWLVALAISVGIGVTFFLVVMHMTYGNFSGHEDFDGLVPTIESLLVTVFSTGLISAALVLFSKKDAAQARQLAISLLSFHSLLAGFGAVTFGYAFIYLNPLGLLAFIMLPRVAWRSSTNKQQTKRWTLIFVCLLLAMLALGAIEFLFITLSDPYSK